LSCPWAICPTWRYPISTQLFVTLLTFYNKTEIALSLYLFLLSICLFVSVYVSFLFSIFVSFLSLSLYNFVAPISLSLYHFVSPISLSLLYLCLSYLSVSSVSLSLLSLCLSYLSVSPISQSLLYLRLLWDNRLYSTLISIFSNLT
jgi:hypothetical protein